MLSICKKIATLSLFATALLGLQGCFTTAVIGTTAAVITKVATDPRTTGRQIDDETLEEKVSYKLNKDAQLQEEARVNVVSYNGHVLLIGQAPSEMAKETAKSIARGVEDVTNVYNEMRVMPKINFRQISQDGWITTKVKSQLLVSAQVKSTDVKVITENGEVFLMGNLNQAQFDAAADVARRVSGVKRVIKVIPYN